MLFEINEEDRQLGSVIASIAGPADVQTCLAPPEQWTRLVAHLRAAGFVVRSEAESGPDLVGAYGKMEPRVREVLARLAPPGTNVTPALIGKVKVEITQIITGELQRMGLPDGTATAMGALLTATMLIKSKEAKNA